MAKPIRIPITFTSDPKAIKKAQSQLADFGKQAGKIAAGVGLAVAGLAAVSIKAFAEFDAAMVKSTAIMGNVSDVMKGEMSDAAREVAKTTTFSAAQAAESFFFLASAGLDAEQSIAAMPKVANFAQAGMFDMALATDLLTDAQSALGLSVDDTQQNMTNMARVSDTLVRANVLANASVQQFSEALTNKAGAALKALGKDVEEGVAVLAAFADQGIKGDEAGTQLGIVLRDLTTKALKNGDAFRAMGVGVFDSTGDMRNMADIIGDLEGALSGMSDQTQKATLLQMGFSDKSLASLQALLGTSDAIREYEAELRNAAGTTDEVAQNQLTSFSAQLDLMKSKFADIGIEIGSKLAPALSGFVGSMDPIIAQLTPALVGMFEALLPVFEQVLAQLPSLLEAVTPIIPAFGDITAIILTLANETLPVLETALGILTPFVTGLTGAFAENGDVMIAIGVVAISFIAIMGVMNTVMKVATAIQTGFAVAMAFSFGWIGLVITIVAALVAGLVYFFAFTETGQKMWGDFVFYLKQQWAEFAHAHAVIVNHVIAGFENMLNKAVEGLNWLAKQANKILPDDAQISMIATVKFGRVEVPKLLTKPIEYTFTPKNLTGYAGAPALGVNDRRAASGAGAPATSNGFGMSPFAPTALGALSQNFGFDGMSAGGFSSSGSSATTNNITVNQGILAGVGTSEAEAGKVIQQYLNAYGRSGGR
jgi:TP901 family phage tail tape measure protein